MDIFLVWANLLLAFIFIVGIISAWRAAIAIKDLMVGGTERVSGWFFGKFRGVK